MPEESGQHEQPARTPGRPTGVGPTTSEGSPPGPADPRRPAGPDVRGLPVATLPVRPRPASPGVPARPGVVLTPPARRAVAARASRAGRWRADTVPPSSQVTNRPRSDRRRCRMCDVQHAAVLPSRERSTYRAQPTDGPGTRSRGGPERGGAPMSPSTDLESDPASHIGTPSPGAPRGVLRALARPTTLTGGITELALVGAHVLMYPLGARTEVLRPDASRRPAAAPPNARALFAADPLAARVPVLLVHGLVDNRSIFTAMRRGPAPPRLRLGVHLELQPDAGRRRPRGRRPRGGDRPDLRPDRARPHPRRRAQPGRADRALPPAAAGRRPADPEPDHPGHPARGLDARPPPAHPAGPAAAPRLAAAAGARRAGAGLRHPASPRSTATSTSWCCRPAPRAATTRTSAPATCSSAAWATCRCPSRGRWSTRSRPRWRACAPRPAVSRGRPPSPERRSPVTATRRVGVLLTHRSTKRHARSVARHRAD